MSFGFISIPELLSVHLFARPSTHPPSHTGYGLIVPLDCRDFVRVLLLSLLEMFVLVVVVVVVFFIKTRSNSRECRSSQYLRQSISPQT